MRNPIIIANWKMNLTPEESVALAQDFKKEIKISGQEAVVCPSLSALPLVGAVLAGTKFILGAQNVFWHQQGAYTGEVSPRDLASIGCRYAIVGHSERRQNLGETDEMINRKIDACFKANLSPIVCLGESREERSHGQTDMVIFRQLSRALAEIELVPSEEIIIAYEPIWAIGSGQTVTPEQADHVFHLMRQIVVDRWPASIVKNNVRFVYGGSVDAASAKNFVSLDLLGGFLVGGASLRVEEFNAIIKSF